MLKILLPKHREAIRRLLVAETPTEVAESLGMNPGTVRKWMNDPVFASALSEMQMKSDQAVVENPRPITAHSVLEDVAVDAALLCAGTVMDEDVDYKLRIKSAWDILDRTQGKPVQRQISTSMSLSDLIIAAHDEIEANN